MGRPLKVPVTPAVVRWAMEQSGYSLEEIAETVEVPVDDISKWLRGQDRPSLSQARAFAAKVRRPFATLLLPKAPLLETPTVAFRHSPGVERRELNPEERKALRNAVRVQKLVSFATRETGQVPVPLPKLQRRAGEVEQSAAMVRSILGVKSGETITWSSPSDALAGWRRSLEKAGVLVFLLPMGRDSCRGFSVWDDHAPLIAANTWWNTEARIFTILHELGHLVTRTSSACVGTPVSGGRGDPLERWCEEFAAAILLPLEEVRQILEGIPNWHPDSAIAELGPIVKLARTYKTSLRAAAIRLIQADLADPGVYAAIPKAADEKREGGGGAGRPRHAVRSQEYGELPARALMEGVEAGVLTRADVLGHLDITHSDLELIAERTSR